MAKTHFTKSEASHKLGRMVRSSPHLPRVPEGTVVNVIRSGNHDWRVRVHWQVPLTTSLIDAGEVSFFRREEPALSDFSKSEYEKLIEEIG